MIPAVDWQTVGNEGIREYGGIKLIRDWTTILRQEWNDRITIIRSWIGEIHIIIKT